MPWAEILDRHPVSSTSQAIINTALQLSNEITHISASPAGLSCIVRCVCLYGSYFYNACRGLFWNLLWCGGPKSKDI